MMSRAARAARLCFSGYDIRTGWRPFATVRSEVRSPDPAKTFSENEFPDRPEPPVITRTDAADVTIPPRTTSAETAHYTIAPTRRIGPTRPAHIPPNVPPETLEIPETKITRLPNGVRVASMENYSQVSTVGVLADFGSRHEWDQGQMPPPDADVSTAGVNHLMELTAFQSTQHHSGAEIRNIMEKLGGAHFATSSREQMLYCVDVLRPNVREAFGLLADTVQYPVIDDTEVEEMKQVIEFQSADILPQIQCQEGLQTAAYEGTQDPTVRGAALQQLGRPHFCAPEALPHLSARSVHAFRERCLLHRPEGIVVSGSGISHDILVELAEEHFGHIPSAASGSAAGDLTVPSTYTGGEYRLQRAPDPNPAKEEFTHVALAFEVGGWHSSDLVPTCVLQTLLGGGSSFSAGGPGKGM